ncbi:MAG TPA: hypothetical protein VM925_10375 [Labilithrix sp.]|nr:hypothetical protein [Labilithrix sp.]
MLFKLGIWDRLVAACDLHVSETVIGEAHFFEDDEGNRHDFDVGGYVKSGGVKIVQRSASRREGVRRFI